MNNTLKKDNKNALVDSIYDFLRQNKYNLEIQTKPKTPYQVLQQSSKNFNKYIPLEIVKKQSSTKLRNQINLIANNIAIKLFQLNNEKFLAVISRMNLWGYQICLEQFILRYYLVIKNDNRLRQFIILYLPKIIKQVKNTIQSQLLSKSTKFNFINPYDKQLENLQYQLKKKQAELLKIDTDKMKENTQIDSTDILSDQQQVLSFKEQILKDLQAKNPELEEALRNA